MRFYAFFFLFTLLLPSHTVSQSINANRNMSGRTSMMDAKSASGTSWQPASSPRSGLRYQTGDWMLNVHGFASLTYTRESDPRGDVATFSTNMLGVHLMKRVGPGVWQARVMFSAEPSMGREGYPLLFQTGETADGSFPLVDRQHPHDLFMELGTSLALNLSSEHEITVYVAAVGEPAIGPPVFMHRGSAGPNPSAPIAHHFLDATHISHGVVTVALASDDRLRLEGSMFNGREPDQDRWNLQAPRFDSYSFRVTVNPSANWSIQASVADLAEPEQLHPGIGVVKLTASVTHNKPLDGGNWQTTLAWGRNKNDRTLINVAEARSTFPDPILNHYIGIQELPAGVPEDQLFIRFPARSQTGLLIESAIAFGRVNVFGRLERTVKDELFDPLDQRHSQAFSVGKIDAGAMFDLIPIGIGSIAVGFSGSVHIIDSALHEAYGTVPAKMQLFTRVTLGR